MTGYVLSPRLFTATEVARTATDRRSLLSCFQPAGRPQLSALSYDAERLVDLP